MSDQQNIIIDSWTSEAREFVLEKSIVVQFGAGDLLCRDGARITHFIFPHSGILIASAPDQLLEMKSTGWEGFVGIPHLIAGGDCAGDVRVLIGGVATLVPCTHLHEANRKYPCVAQSMGRYGRFAIHTMMQTVACIRSQNVEQIIALWLATASVRLRTDDIPVTHETLANLLGLRRATVTTTLAKLSREGILETNRGYVHICHWNDLEQAAGMYYVKWKNSLAELTAALPPERPDSS